MELLISVFCILIPILIFWKLDTLKQLFNRKKKYHFADFYALDATENGVLPSELDRHLDGWKTGDVLYFFGFDRNASFQLTLKIRNNRAFFILRINHKDSSFENCGQVEQEYRGFRGRYLQVSKLEDGRRWRIVVLCRLYQDGQKSKFVKINLFFQALQAPVGEWIREGSESDLCEWTQWGVLHGVLTSGEDVEDLYLRGVRGRQKVGKAASLVFHGDYGKMAMIWKDELVGKGSLYLPGEIVSQIHKLKVKNSTAHTTYNFADDDNTNHTLVVDPNDNHAQCDNEKGQIALLEIPSLNMAPEAEVDEVDKRDPQTYPNLVSFIDPRCDDSNLTGGKGSSLGKLSKINGITVPNGFCITTVFWENLVDEELKEVLRLVEKATRGFPFNQTDLEMACENARQKIFKLEISDELVKQIENLGNSLFSRNIWEVKLAVRSSAVGEDGVYLSCAGQNDTFLGVVEKTNVMESIGGCWASLYSYRSVEYRRQHGQPILTSMSVVIQEMVDPAAAGVIFTCDPLTGEEGRITVTANWGLGESVVGGEAEPDTIVLEVEHGEFKVCSKVIGSKMLKYIMKDEGEIEEIRIDVNDDKCCISDDQACHLAKLAASLDEMMSCALDIEFALTRDTGDIKILQARPVTTSFSWTDWELEHEFDTAKPSNKDISTRGNLGEVFPGACTPLTISSVIKPLDLAIAQACVPKADERSYVSHTTTWLALISQQAFLNVLDGIHKYPEETLSVASKGLDYSIFGHSVTTQDMLNCALMRHKTRGNIKQNLILMKDLMNRKKVHEKTLKTLTNLTIFPNLDEKTKISSRALYQDISSKFHFLLKACLGHVFNSEKSSVVQVIILLILAGDQEIWTAELLAGVATLLTLNKSGSVESAGVPSGLENLVQTIKMSNGWEEGFANTDEKNAECWLKKELAKSFDEFNSQFGHRCLKEFDLFSETWGSNFTPVIKTLQSMLNSTYYSNTSKKDQSILESLPVGKRLAMKLLLPLAHSCVANREASKSLLIRTVGQFRNAYRRLGQILAETGVLPDKDLVCFLTHNELQQLICDSHSDLVLKTVRRKKLYYEWDQMKFPEMVFGYPPSHQITEELLQRVGSDVTGTPACPGRVTGTARVVLHISEASSIQAGDILITQSTDIGWSPYFPILGGVVTELGGLISHGAVVAREYGLPCLVGAAGATRLFISGDTVCLDTNKGLLTKVERGLE